MSVYKDFNIQDPDSPLSSDIVTNVKDTVSSGMWADGAGTLTSFFTSSAAEVSYGTYYLDVWDKNPTSDTTATVQFSVAYGHIHGSGSTGALGVDGNRESATIYRQLANTLLGPTEDRFTFEASDGAHTTPSYIYAISIARQQLREKMDPGNWELHLTSGSKTVSLIDDSGANTNPTLANSKREFNVVSGSIANGVYEPATTTATATVSGSHGLFYPESGMIILNPNSLVSGSGYNRNDNRGVIEPLTKSTCTNDYDHRKLLMSIKSGSYFSSRREEQKRSSFYFCDVRSGEFNHSQNPSFFTGSNAELVNNSFKTEPTTYITTVGLYNDNNELLAVAKMSQPFKKDPNTEALIKVRLDY